MNECLTTPQHEKQIGYWVSMHVSYSHTFYLAIISDFKKITLFTNIYDWSKLFHVIIKTNIHICMKVSFTLFLACNRNDFMTGQIHSTSEKKLNHDGF